MGAGEEPVKRTSRTSLRLLGSVGEPINPEAWEWYHRVVGDSRCPIVDTWWQTETGGILITPLPGAIGQKPGSATRPFFGCKPEIVDADGKVQTGACEGNLVIADSWPGQMRTVYGDHQRFIDTYWTRFEGKYFAGDGAKKDDDGDLWLLGRVDDVMNVSGHRISTTEVESALVSNPMVAEAAVVGATDETTGQGIVAFVILRGGAEEGSETVAELRNHVAKEIGPIAKPRQIMVVAELPKTRSGKIMRRLLRDVAAGVEKITQDTTTLEDFSVVARLRAGDDE
jgi:acetyl-CoA synthetase